MTGNFLALDESQAIRILEDPESLGDFLFQDDQSIYDTDRYLDLDKCWQALHFLLTGSNWEGDPPACNVVLGGEEIGENLGYGPARILSVEQVHSINEYLNSLCVSSIQSKFNAEELNQRQIYPSMWSEDDCDHILNQFNRLQMFYRTASIKQMHVLQFLS